jgi:hypothetical protein
MAVLAILAAVSACGGSPVTGPTDELPASSQSTPAPKPETWIVWGQSNALGCAEGPGYDGGPGVEAWSAGRWVPASEPLPFMDPYSFPDGRACESGWAVAAANAVGRPVRLTGHTHVAKPIGWWPKDPSKLLRNLKEAKEATWLIAYQGESEDRGAERRLWPQRRRSAGLVTPPIARATGARPQAASSS